MAEIIKDNIKFSNIPNIVATGFTGLLTNSDNISNKRYEYDPESDPILMALDINWGGAEVDENKVINTTGELLTWIKEGLAAAAQSGGSVELTEEQIATIETCSHLLAFIKDYALSTAYADEHYQAKGDYVLASVYNENKAAIDAAIEALQQASNGITEERVATIESNLAIATTALLSKVDEARVNAIIDAKGYQTEAQVNAKIQAVVGAAPEALDTLKEIADKLAADDDVVAGLTNQISEKANAADVYNKTEADTKFAKKADFDEFVEEVNNANETTAEALVQLQDNLNNIQLTPGATGPQGPKGDTGAAGAAGADGQPGAKGDKGDTGADGADGKSAYELYKETVNEQEAQPAIYSFESFNNAAKEVKYGEGTVKVIEMRAGGATIEVISNNSTDPNAADFVGQQFNIATALATNDPIQLYTLDNNPVNIWVTVELVSEAQEAVVAMTQAEWLASLKGAAGAQGPKGDTGAQGPKGDTGTFDASALENYATKTFVGEKIAEVIGAAPETLDTLEEIAAKLQEVEGITGIKGDKGDTGETGAKGDTGAQGPKGDTGAQGPKGDTGEAGPKGDTGEAGPKGDTGAQGPKGDTGTFDSSALAGYVTIEQYNALLARVVALEGGTTGETGEGGETGGGEPDNAYLTPTTTKPTSASIAAMTFPAEKPTAETLETSEITRPTELYLVYPSAWVTANANEDITNPVITDPNGFAQGAWVDSTVTVDGVAYTIIGTELGQDTYTITFN